MTDILIALCFVGLVAFPAVIRAMSSDEVAEETRKQGPTLVPVLAKDGAPTTKVA
jgi:hypothetical protein